MEAPEVPTEHLHEHINEHAQGHGGNKARWVTGVALTAALLAALAAVASLLAGHYVNEALIDQIRSSDQWDYYQAKGVKAAVLASKIELLAGLGKSANPADQEKIAQYEKDQKKIQTTADEMEKSSRHYLEIHVVFARAVTMFQVAIAVSAISVLTRRRQFWFVGLAFGFVGLIFLIQGLLLG